MSIIKKVLSVALVLTLVASSAYAESVWTDLIPKEGLNEQIDKFVASLEKDYKDRSIVLGVLTYGFALYTDKLKDKLKEINDCLEMIEKHNNNSLVILLEDDFTNTGENSAYSALFEYLIAKLSLEKYGDSDTYDSSLEEGAVQFSTFIFEMLVFRGAINSKDYKKAVESANNLKTIIETFVTLEEK